MMDDIFDAGEDFLEDHSKTRTVIPHPRSSLEMEHFEPSEEESEIAAFFYHTNLKKKALKSWLLFSDLQKRKEIIEKKIIRFRKLCLLRTFWSIWLKSHNKIKYKEAEVYFKTWKVFFTLSH